MSNARLSAFSRAEQDPGSKQECLYQVRAKVHPGHDTSPGSGQQPMAREEQGTQASILQPCCCLTSQHQAICSQGASQRRSSVTAFGVHLKTRCCTVVRKRMQTQSFQRRQREGARWVFSYEYLGRKAWKESSSVWQQQLLHHHRKTSGKNATGELS